MLEVPDPKTPGRRMAVFGVSMQHGGKRARSGKLLHVIRVDATGPHWAVPDLKSTGK